MARGGIYHGTVIHTRLRPVRHRLRYRIFYLLLDLDDLPALHGRSRLFSHNRLNLFSFHDRDHGPRDGRPLRPWIDDRLREAGIDLAGGSISVLCLPRVLGYGFNPLSIFFCHHADGRLMALLHEVSNTFGQWHGYLIPVDDGNAPVVRQQCDKAFYVSPFIPVSGEYRFRVLRPGQQIGVTICQRDSDGPRLVASLVGQRAPLTDRTLAAAAAWYPWLTVKVIAGIHWEALKLWLKGAPFVRRPPAPESPVSIIARSYASADQEKIRA